MSMNIDPAIISQIAVGLVLAGIIWERVGTLTERLDSLETVVSRGQRDIRGSVDRVRERLDSQNHRLTDLERQMERRKGIQEGISRSRETREP